MRKLIKVLFSIIMVAAVFWAVVNIIPTKKVAEDGKNPFIATDKTLISAHRGGAELNPENTKRAFDYVIEDTTYTDIVEIDVRTTKDGKMVIIHDETINRTGIKGEAEPVKIIEHDYLELLKYNLGVNFVDRNGNKPYENINLIEAGLKGLLIMTLEEFLISYNRSRDNLKLYLEIKEDNEIGKLAADKCMDLLEKYSWWQERTMIISFSTAVVDYISEKYPDQLVGALGYKIAPQLICGILGLDSLCKSNYQSFQTQTVNTVGPIKINCATKRIVKACHKRNQSITYWTINDEETMKQLIDIKADVITTNAPDVLAKILNK